jgi:septum formation protein
VPVDTLILASASARRQELLARVYPHFVVEPCPYAEPPFDASRVRPQEWVLALAHFKARAIADRHPECWVLGADTVVACADEILGKPHDKADARRMLELQARQASEVITGVCLLCMGRRPRRLAQTEVTRVWMRDDPTARRAYLESGDWAGKAGAYGIQTVGDRLVERIDGSYSNVVGLPVGLVSRLLRMAGYAVGGPVEDERAIIAPERTSDPVDDA